MRHVNLGLLLTLGGCFICQAACAADAMYVGTWKTTNRKLDGTMTCAVKELGDEKWQGRFYGVWQGVPFDYTVAFSGPPVSLRGTATIDGANYTWTGTIAPGNSEAPGAFQGTFGGSRYNGSFALKEQSVRVAGSASRQSTLR
jgi:hypothetical protein